MNLQEHELIIPTHSRPKNTIESDDEDQKEVMKMMREKEKIKQQQGQVQGEGQIQGRKKMPADNTTQKQNEKASMEIEGRIIRKKLYKDLDQEIVMYLTDILPFPLDHKLFITGVMPNGQTMNLVVTEPNNYLYFSLRRQYSDIEALSQPFLKHAEEQIKNVLYQAGITNFMGQFVEKTYVFELEGVYREKRPYYQVIYRFGEGKDIRADLEGQYFKYVFGTSFHPLELMILNNKIKGPCWVKIDKQYLNQTTKWVLGGGLCAQLQYSELIQVVDPSNQKEHITSPEILQVQKITRRPPTMRIMSLSIKAVVPSQVKRKNLFNSQHIEQIHIYAISYYFCDQYDIESKPAEYKGQSRTLFLKEFGPQLKNAEFQTMDSESRMFALLQSQIKRHDPDVLVCHDGTKILDTLIQRMARIGDINNKPSLGRLNIPHSLSKFNQNKRINYTVAGRLVCDTFIHAKDMIKSVDYQLESMVAHIKPQRAFRGLSQEQTLGLLSDNKAFTVIKKCREEAQLTFALMNHLQILQMTRQLSNICGNTWKRSLQLQRAERNQYLIMHQCIKEGYIIPDKFKKQKNDDEEEDRKKYQGGHVLDPLKGFYKDYILLLDFNSLYPSIIREYNVCFSVIQRPLVPLSHYYRPKNSDKEKYTEKEKIRRGDEQFMIEEKECQVQPPEKSECSRQKWGFLPQLIDRIVTKRKQCKKSMKNASADRAIILDIQQKCYKLVANSIYGCLGFNVSRFYSKHLAALITRKGRQALMRAKQIVGGTGGVRVIYGDTDSLMIQPTGIQLEQQRAKLWQIKKIADDLKGRINKQYDNLQIDIDGIFKPLILLMKKKYVARKLENFDKVIERGEQPVFNLEYKGIEVVRRDGFELARKFLRRMIEILMNSDKSEPQETYEEIYAYAKEFIEKEFRKQNYREFLFSRQLNKAPIEYARGQTIPHVKVALDRIKNGERAETLVNHTIYYIVCKPKEASQDSLAKCSYDDRTFQRSQKFVDEKGPLEIDEDYYKRQLLQPVGRITQHLTDFSTDRLLEQIGLSDEGRKKFKKQMQVDREQGQAILQGCISHSSGQKAKRFVQLVGEIPCVCGFKMAPATEGKLTLLCLSCKRTVIPSISNRLQLILRDKNAEYYNNKFKCRCLKQYNLTPLSNCCKIKYRPRSNVPFELHELVYLGKDLIMATEKDAGEEVGIKMRILDSKLNQFLDFSDYERVEGVSNILTL